MTLSNSTGSDPKALDASTGFSVIRKSAKGESSSVETTGVAAIDRNGDVEAWPLLEQARRRALTDTAAAITQAENGLQYFLDPRDGLEMEGPPAPPPKPVIHRSREEVCNSLIEAALTNDLPTPFFIRLLQQESGFQPGIVSTAGAQGVAQFMPQTAADVGLDNPFDPAEAIPASAKLLRSLFEKFGNLGLAAAAYNAGPKRIQEWLAKKGKLPDETRGYVKIITGREAESWKEASAAGMPPIRLPRAAPCQQAAGLHAWNGPQDVPMPPPSPLRAAETIPVVPAKTSAKEAVTANRTTVSIQLSAHRTQQMPRARSAKNEKAGRTGRKPGEKIGKPLQLADAHR